MPQVIESGIAYLALKVAQKIFNKSPIALQPNEFEHVRNMALRQHKLEFRVLRTKEARDVIVPPSTLKDAMQEIRGRYPSESDFISDLERNGLDESGFASALECEMKVEAILEKVSSQVAKIGELDVALYYQFHTEKFGHPETRLARHILITINETIAENTRQVAYQRINAIALRLTKEPSRFEEQALKHSECPTALDGGKLGDLPRGKLFLELDKALFELRAGEVSGVLESELGFHVLRCDVITEAGVLTLDQARPHIRKLLEQKRKRAYQQAWVKGLLDQK